MASGSIATEPNQSYADTRENFSSGISWWSAVIQATPNTSIATPLKNITAARPAAGSGTASAADGRASGKTHRVPTNSRRRGFHRIITSAPPTVPTPKAARARPQGAAPPSSSSATSGP